MIKGQSGANGHANSFEKLPPLTIIGLGEADMDFLNELGAYSENFVIENVVEGVPVQDQLAISVQKHLKNVILKDIHLRYFSGETEIITTQNQINFWEENHQGSMFLIAGNVIYPECSKQ